jgi:hypothetical protein
LPTLLINNILYTDEEGTGEKTRELKREWTEKEIE